MELENHGYMELRALRPSSVGSDKSVFSEADGAPRHRALSNSKPGIRALCWTICSATALYTTKRLMVNHNYPATIAFRTFAVTLLVYAIALFTGTESSHTYNGELFTCRMRRPSWSQILSKQTWRGMLPVSLMAAASLPMLFQGLLHMPSLPVLVMLFPIIPALESLVLYIHNTRQSTREQYLRVPFPWCTFGTLSASSLVLYNEHRLMVPGLIWGVSSGLTIGVVRGLLVIKSLQECENEARLQRFHGFFIMTLLFGLFISFSISYLFELPAKLNVPRPTLDLMFINTASFIATTFTGTSLMAYSPISLVHVKLAYSIDSESSFENFASFASSILVLMAVICSKPPTVVSWIQIIMYFLATLCLLRIDQAHATVVEAANLVQQMLRLLCRNLEIRTPRKSVSVCTVCLVFAFLAIGLCTLESMSLSSISSQDYTSLDSTYYPSSPFDIVVSAYLEEPESIKSMLDSIKKTAYLRKMTPNVILYTKDPGANVTALKDLTGANAVKLLENVGREGGTYLQHIVTNWDVLAEKTMFIQAHAHNIRELIPRIDSYLVANTGMLSLGFTGITCSCLTCQDRWGWEDFDNVIPTLYEKIYNQACDSNTSILLSYKGQFVGSAKRLRGIDKAVYEKLLLAVTADEGWDQGESMVNYEQSPDNPVFGFTLERIWGLILQCATDSRVAVHCPSLLSGKGFGDHVADCQCLDP